jgi:hypothetical protein
MAIKLQKITKIQKVLLVILLIFILAIFWRFFDLLSFPDSSIVLQKGALVKLHKKENLTQNFTANRDGLSKVEVLLRSPGIKFENGDKMKMEILDASCEKNLQEGFLTDAFLNTENLYEFRFDRIDDSQDQEFCLKATFQNQKENAKAIQFFTMGEGENQPLSIRPVYKNESVCQDLSELNQRMSQYKPWFLKHYYLWTISILFLILSISLIAILIII